MYIYIYLYIYLYIYFYFYICIFICMYVYYIYIYLNPYPYLYLYLYHISISIYLYLYLYLYLYISISKSVSIYLNIYKSIYLSIYLSIYRVDSQTCSKFLFFNHQSSYGSQEPADFGALDLGQRLPSASPRGRAARHVARPDAALPTGPLGDGAAGAAPRADGWAEGQREHGEGHLSKACCGFLGNGHPEKKKTNFRK